KALAAAAGDRERRLIDARALQMEAEAAPADVSKLTAYRAALDRALAAYPSNEELWLARGKAESRDPAERGQGSVDASAPFYRKALTLAPDHFAAHHYLAHAFENTNRPKDALTEAAVYARLAPQSPQARRVQAHDLPRARRVAGAIRPLRGRGRTGRGAAPDAGRSSRRRAPRRCAAAAAGRVPAADRTEGQGSRGARTRRRQCARTPRAGRLDSGDVHARRRRPRGARGRRLAVRR